MDLERKSGNETEQTKASQTEKWKAAALAVSKAVTPPDVVDVIARVHRKVVQPLEELRTGVPIEWRRRYWALGPNKWSEAIDGRHWQHGPAVYDFCLHGGNSGAIDPGYLGAMFTGFECIEAFLGQRTTPKMWYQVHECAMAHCWEMQRDLAGSVRTSRNYVVVPPSWEGAPNGMTPAAKAEIAAYDPHICTLVENTEHVPGSDGVAQVPGGFRLEFAEVDAATMQRNLQTYLDEFYDRMTTTTADPTSTALDQIRHIAWIHQVMVRMEPARDGNLRTATLFLNKHLIEAGFYPSLLGWPDGAEVLEHALWFREVVVGMALWRNGVRSTAPELFPELAEIAVPDTPL
eukprot:m.244427 g.244427  ORF g.244427 m.244427 type:complete len:347 (-) comp19472_c0_seq5:346-1386(-)